MTKTVVEEIPTDGQRRMSRSQLPTMDTPPARTVHHHSVLVQATWTLAPYEQDQWLAVWLHLAQSALRRRCCHQFDVSQDHHDPAQWRVMSEWESREEFNRFIRESGLLWMARNTPCPLVPADVQADEIERKPVDKVAGSAPASRRLSCRS